MVDDFPYKDKMPGTAIIPGGTYIFKLDEKTKKLSVHLVPQRGLPSPPPVPDLGQNREVIPEYGISSLLPA